MTVTTDIGPSRSFIETQFPVSKLSKESYDERKGSQGQALTGLGKWWGRKPLVLVRALILGLLLPSTDDPTTDREVFLTLMAMDDDGLWRRYRGGLTAEKVAALASPREKAETFEVTNGKPSWKSSLSASERRHMTRRAFLRLNYDDRLMHCAQVEEAGEPAADAWERINAHLGTSAGSLAELVRELGIQRFGHPTVVGDAFSGGGSIPFAAARLGCDVVASDLNPVAGMLTWAALNIVGGGEDVVRRVTDAQERVYQGLCRQVEAWGIERTDAAIFSAKKGKAITGWVADAYLYCLEVRDPRTGWLVPLAPSWVIARRAKQVVARLIPDPARRRFNIDIVEGVTTAELAYADREGTWADGVRSPVDSAGHWLPVEARLTASMTQVIGPAGLRPWENDDIVPRAGDVYQERLYCVRYRHPETGERVYRAPDAGDSAREARVLELLRERFVDWQAKGYIPSRRIEQGQKTDEPIRTRGWTHWHHLFNPRQLLLGGLHAELGELAASAALTKTSLLLATGRHANQNSRLSRWVSSTDQAKDTFYNQALNTLVNYACRPSVINNTVLAPDTAAFATIGSSKTRLSDARILSDDCDIWMTDPGYGDSVMYDELSEFFLAWYDKRLASLFPGWYSDSKRALAVKGGGETFRLALADCYRNLAQHMPDNGYQVVLFVHQDAEVWADMALIFWAAGMQVCAAWNIQTETASAGIKKGNYIQGTVCLVLKKRLTARTGDVSDLFPDIQAEVAAQIESMTALDDGDGRNFGDADLQLAAYAAAMQVITGYSSLTGIDVERELRRPRQKGKPSELGKLIAQAVKIASDALVPDGLERTVWRRLAPDERLYLKGIAIESAGESKQGVYLDLARGYGAASLGQILASSGANAARLKTPSELGGRGLGGDGLAGTLLRKLLYAVFLTAQHAECDPRPARDFVRHELNASDGASDYWNQRETILAVLRFLQTTPAQLPHWQHDADAARLLWQSIDSDRM